MNNLQIVYCLVLIFLVGCKSNTKEDAVLQKVSQEETVNTSFTFVFASCNDQEREQPLWQPIMDNAPELFVWGGDNIYSDTADMQKMQADYNTQLNQPDYKRLQESVPIIGTWDDHDYGINDGGVEWPKKQEAQQLFLDFIKVAKAHPLRKQEGVYYKHEVVTEQGSIQFLMLDTRYFRSPLLASKDPDKRYDSWPEDYDGTILGAQQWRWLAKQLHNDSYDFTFILTSIQFLNDFHGWERWGTFPGQVNKFNAILQQATAKNIILLSGDRHQGEISVNRNTDLAYPLVDFTSSGLTHTFPGTPFEENPFRVGQGTKALNFGVIKVDFKNSKVDFELRGLNNALIESYSQQY